MRFLRPPGARPEKEFLARCIQCGQCAEVCPYKSISLKTGFSLRDSGTPMIFPGQIPCYLCMRCPPVCPSGALEPITEPAQANMGRGKIDRPNCYVWGDMIICRSCFENCPLKGRAIILDKGIYPIIVEDCVGCGICEHVCPRKCITVTPKA